MFCYLCTHPTVPSVELWPVKAWTDPRNLAVGTSGPEGRSVRTPRVRHIPQMLEWTFCICTQEARTPRNHVSQWDKNQKHDFMTTRWLFSTIHQWNYICYKHWLYINDVTHCSFFCFFGGWQDTKTQLVLNRKVKNLCYPYRTNLCIYLYLQIW